VLRISLSNGLRSGAQYQHYVRDEPWMETSFRADDPEVVDDRAHRREPNPGYQPPQMEQALRAQRDRVRERRPGTLLGKQRWQERVERRLRRWRQRQEEEELRAKRCCCVSSPDTFPFSCSSEEEEGTERCEASPQPEPESPEL
jgi:hypothetical protein